ncbi:MULTISPECIES: CaiB/BaiF CoA-transferase family protein [Cupriavidus]|uniref:CaiB/BaiF CoA transferase family protein n=1 Tax=Cupriavidus TaxID=106589 RepID=UPI00157A49B4|nr:MULTISPECIES: CoA transferase [Cupriavidus]MBB1632491.1 acetyl-CoA acetyltransferase [Cupriavidus sp. UME77]NUA32108.1 CoA transferase [Cupriavidus basilensis]
MTIDSVTQLNGPLAGFRILDLTTVIMGPYGTRILADMGADVIKIESPEGDSFRAYGPARHPGMGGSILNLHRNKRSLKLDLKDPLARDAFDKLIASSDVLIHNLRPNPARRLGLDWASISKVAPNLVLCAARGFSCEGPYGDKPAYDDLLQAGSGFAALGTAIHGEPRYAPTAWCDKIAGQAIAYAVLGALLHRVRGGGGQEVEVPMFEVSVDFMLAEHFGAGAFEPPMGPSGFARQLSARRRPYRTKDGWACILPYSDKNWKDFFAFIGRSELCTVERFATISNRVTHIDELYTLIEEHSDRFLTKEWVDYCDEVGIPCMPVLGLDELRNDPHFVATGMFEVVEHPSEGSYHHIRPAIRYSATPCGLNRFAPRSGEHTREILDSLGLPQTQVDRLVTAATADQATPDPKPETSAKASAK